MTEIKTRRRGEELEHAILDAAWAELHDVGYTALTIEGVAARAGTSKPVIYRRWAGRAELVLAAWARQAPQPQPIPDSGMLRTDLVALFTRITIRHDAVMSEVIAGVMSDVFRDPEVAELLRERLRTAMPAIPTIVGRAIERGELPPFEVPPRVARLPLDLIRNESMLCNGVLTSDMIAELVDDVYLPLLRGLAQRAVRA
ncbi:TetR/AcrR family transcriptional regulator [Labedaea rhizosphaerae]|uniref:TetR family transcriptional regulator n=1 Tax=Labedaea rhizosphaerae TaxID=598644 RepID=A0A4R6SFL6_LABRH|nr:TetR/AcrR family transcriptional regulator [Labedaea rhizosphaerae]TDQ00287.1 TetR family transcriptional regulator [Labedaea rhizosphaerae]